MVSVDKTMTHKAKTLTEARVLKYHLQSRLCCGRVTLSKQMRPAMTTPLYTNSITGRKPIGKTYALVRPKPCEHDPRFVVVLQKNESKLLREWDNTAHCPVAKTEDYKVIVSLLTRANQVATRYIS